MSIEVTSDVRTHFITPLALLPWVVKIALVLPQDSLSIPMHSLVSSRQERK